MNPTISSWDELEITPLLLRGIYNCGFENPSPIQSVAIAPILAGNNIIAQAQSGTGKTATFSIGAISSVDISISKIQVIVLAPTRELAKQIHTVVSNLGKFISQLKVKVCVGGTSIHNELRQLRDDPPHIVIGCPGRILDCLQKNGIDHNTIKLLIMDEADELLSSGFLPQIQSIVEAIPSTAQVALFSATLPDHIRPCIQNIFPTPPVEILVKQEALTLEGISQYYVAVNDDIHKYDTLKDLYKSMSMAQCIIYCNSVRRVITLHQQLTDDGFTASCIHGEMDKRSREESFEEFKTGISRILISSNITSRGIDIQQVSIVINYDVPNDVCNYLHRIGRSGRWGRKGTGINFITRRDISKMRDIETYYNTVIEELPNTWHLG
jgi:translation initiation factor 4A